MHRTLVQVGNIIELKDKYSSTAKYALVIYVNKAESLGPGGWISFDYLIMTNAGQLVNISDACVARIIR